MLVHAHYMMTRGKPLCKWSFGTICLAQAPTYRICIPYFLFQAPDNYLHPFVSASLWRPPTPSCSPSARPLSKPPKQVRNKGGECLSTFTAGKDSIWWKDFLYIVWVSNHLTNQNPQSRWKRCEVQCARIKKDAAHLKIICLLQRQFISRRRSDVYMKWRIAASYLYGATHHLLFWNVSKHLQHLKDNK